ncbi:hypothetical protein MHN84_15920, partial [Mycobacterium sp. PSTR-4-N]|nr:hypothetical protein [Mycobacterium sp. PSTR-4-N]
MLQKPVIAACAAAAALAFAPLASAGGPAGCVDPYGTGCAAPPPPPPPPAGYAPPPPPPPAGYVPPPAPGYGVAGPGGAAGAIP